jgi:hypothetical protein
MKLLCNLLGHKYYYYYSPENNNKDFRFCIHCHNLDNWKYIPGTTKKVWMGQIQYNNKNVSKNVEGYGKE